MDRFDYILVGGGLQNGLIVRALRARRPAARILLIERAARLGGNHTWCFHEEDVEARSREWLEALVVHRWPGYDVRFPRLRRTIEGVYSAVTSERLHAVVGAEVQDHAASRLLLESEVSDVEAGRVTLRSGETVEGGVVVDGRGPLPPANGSRAGYQKFLGLELQLADAHGLERPLLMDATVDQSEGFRFFYVLPLAPAGLLVEDTYFHQSPALEPDALRRGILSYAASRGWEVRRIVREEVGVLPMPWSGRFVPPRRGPLAAGYRGGWFHPGTGYSFPVAVRLAEFIAGRPPSALFGPQLTRFGRRHARQVLFTHFLNRFLFRWYPPAARHSIFERFYRLPAATIGDFYALRLTSADRFRLLSGRPPSGLSLRYRLGGKD